MTRLTLQGRDGMQVVLITPRTVRGGLEAGAVMFTDPASKPQTVKDPTTKRRYRIPAVPRRGLFPMRFFFPEVP